jgi:SAM-dependent methyltransferase
MWTEVKSGLSGMLPGGVKRFLRRQRAEAIRRRNRGRDVAEIFAEIYQGNRWGGEHGSFNSGSGSTDEHARQYARAVNCFIAEQGIRRVVDLGCGDFRVGALLLESGIDYVGVDVVESLVQENTRRFGSERVKFQCLDIITDRLPRGELCLIRQVLQHLSNEQIARILANTAQYPFVLVTEHYPAAHALREKNRDKPPGEDVRIYDGSAVYLDAPPFDRAGAELLLDVDAGDHLMHPGERLRTYLVRNVPPQAASVAS